MITIQDYFCLHWCYKSKATVNKIYLQYFAKFKQTTQVYYLTVTFFNVLYFLDTVNSQAIYWQFDITRKTIVPATWTIWLANDIKTRALVHGTVLFFSCWTIRLSQQQFLYISDATLLYCSASVGENQGILPCLILEVTVHTLNSLIERMY